MNASTSLRRKDFNCSGPLSVVKGKSVETIIARSKKGLESSDYLGKKLAEIDKVKNSERNNDDILEKLEFHKRKAKTNQLRPHRLMWMNECERLGKRERYLENEVSMHLNNFLELYPSACDLSTVCGFIETKQAQSTSCLQVKDDLFSQVINVKHLCKKLQRQSHEEAEKAQTVLEQFKRGFNSMGENLQKTSDSLLNELLQFQEQLAEERIADMQQDPWLKDEDGMPHKLEDLESVDEVLKQHRLKAYERLKEQFEDDLYNLECRYAKTNQLASLDAKVPSGTWSPSDHFKFVKILDEYILAGDNSTVNSGKLRGDMIVERVKLEVPGKTSLEVLNHERWYREYLKYTDLKKTMQRMFVRQKWEFLLDTQRLFREAREEKLRLQEKYEELEQRLQTAEMLHQKLKDWREQRMKQLMKDEEIRREEQMREMERKEREEKKRLEEKEKKSMRIQEYRIRLEEQEREEMEVQKWIKEIEDAMAIERAKYNEDRVQFRCEKELEKKEMQRQKELLKQAQEEETQRKLELLRAQVAPTHIQSDWNRIQSETESFIKAKNTKEEKAMFSVNGYSDKQILKDQRARLALALGSMNLTNSAYAKEAFARLQPSKLPREMLNKINNKK